MSRFIQASEHLVRHCRCFMRHPWKVTRERILKIGQPLSTRFVHRTAFSRRRRLVMMLGKFQTSCSAVSEKHKGISGGAIFVRS